MSHSFGPTATRWLALPITGALAFSLTACTSDSPSPTPSAPLTSAVQAQSGTPSSTSPQSPTTSAGPAASGTSGAGMLTLDSAERPKGEVVWGMKTTVDGWTPKIFDQNGYNQLVGTNGCQVTTFQAQGDLSQYPGDGEVSLAKVTDFENTMKTEALNAKAVGHTRAPFARAVGGVEKGNVEFVVTRVDYTRKDNGEEWTSYFAARGFAKAGYLLTANLSCKREAFEKDKGLLSTMVKLVSVQA